LLDPKHLIFEYKAGQSFASFTADRANRFIVSRDFANSMLATIDDLQVSSSAFDLIILAGVHLLDGMDVAVQQERLAKVESVLDYSDVKTHLELGSTGSMAFLKRLVATVLPKVESLGLNEQELVSLCEALNLQVRDPTPIGWIDSLKRRIESFTTRVVKTDEDRVRQAMKSSIPPVLLVQRAIELIFALNPKLERVHLHRRAGEAPANRPLPRLPRGPLPPPSEPAAFPRKSCTASN